MEWLSSFAGTNGIPLLVTVIILVGVIIYGIKKGALSFHGHGFDVGQDIKTRNLIQSQFEYTNAMFEGTVASLPKGLDIYRSKWIIARAEDIIQKAIIFNNMTTNPSYIQSKQALVYQAVLKRAEADYFKTPEFKDYCYNFVEKLITDLVRMKESSSN